jgi:site-specific recombinase XerD
LPEGLSFAATKPVCTVAANESPSGVTRASHALSFHDPVDTFAQSAKPNRAAAVALASPHWMRHTHATHALARGAELTTVWDDPRHASIATISIDLQSDEIKRARQMTDAFAAR